MSEPFVGQIIAVGFNFVPQGWLACDGSALSISEFSTLFNLIGTTYGGNGTTTFNVPDLRGRSPVNAGQGGGLSPYVLGQSAGSESVTLSANQAGSHNHPLMASSQTASVSTPGVSVAIGQVPTTAPVKVFGTAPGNTTLSANAIGASGNSQPHENRQPYQTINYIISPFGIFPSQS
jgi:microcystin-dependent protein